MNSLNPMFNRKIKTLTKPNNLLNPNTIKKERKKRSDSKHDIKIPLTLEERQILKALARRYRISSTQYCSLLISNQLKTRTNFPPVEYRPTNKKTVHAKLIQSDYDILFKFSIQWDCSVRQAAYRILKWAIALENAGDHFEKL